MPLAHVIVFHVYPVFIILQMTPLAVYFMVQPPPCMNSKDVIGALLYFQFKDRLTRWKRQEAYDVQKACHRLFWGCTNGNAVRAGDSSAA